MTEEDFCEYYNKVSATVDDDKQFESILNSVWNLNRFAYGK